MAESPFPAEPAASARAGAILTVDLGAVTENYRLLAGIASPSVCAAVVKADGYGLGAVRVARALRGVGCKTFFVAHLDEGIALRSGLGREPEIAILHGLMPGVEDECAEHGLTPVLSAVWQVDAWLAAARRRGRILPAILQVDSGMTRFGLSETEARRLAAEPDRLAALDLRLVMSHLACADEPAHPANAAQRASFGRVRALWPDVPASLAASSGIFLGPDYRFDLVRPGAALYGIAPQPGLAKLMRPVVRLQAKVVQLRDVPADTPVGYGWTASTAAPARLATISIGYGDGLLRALSGRGSGWLGGIRLPMVGRVSMDSVVLDATELPEDGIAPGTPIDLIGPDQSLDDLAAAAGTIGYELLTALGSRFHRIYLGG